MEAINELTLMSTFMYFLVIRFSIFLTPLSTNANVEDYVKLFLLSLWFLFDGISPFSINKSVSLTLFVNISSADTSVCMSSSCRCSSKKCIEKNNTHIITWNYKCNGNKDKDHKKHLITTLRFIVINRLSFIMRCLVKFIEFIDSTKIGTRKKKILAASCRP